MAPPSLDKEAREMMLGAPEGCLCPLGVTGEELGLTGKKRRDKPTVNYTDLLGIH